MALPPGSNQNALHGWSGCGVWVQAAKALAAGRINLAEPFMVEGGLSGLDGLRCPRPPSPPPAAGLILPCSLGRLQCPSDLFTASPWQSLEARSQSLPQRELMTAESLISNLDLRIRYVSPADAKKDRTFDQNPQKEQQEVKVRPPTRRYTAPNYHLLTGVPSSPSVLRGLRSTSTWRSSSSYALI